MHFFCEAHSSQWRSDGFNQCNYCEPPPGNRRAGSAYPRITLNNYIARGARSEILTSGVLENCPMWTNIQSFKTSCTQLSAAALAGNPRVVAASKHTCLISSGSNPSASAWRACE